MLYSEHKNKCQHFYTLNGHILQQVQNNPYHGLQISEDLKWTTHTCIASVAKKGQFDLGLSQKKPQILSTTYISLVRSTMEYGGIIWDPYTETNINRLERIQRQAADSLQETTGHGKKGVSPTYL